MNNLISKYKDKLRSPKTLVIIGLLGILLIAVSSLSGGKKTENEIKTPSEMSPEEYRISLEEDICKIVSQITGSNKVETVVTLDSGIRYSYADTREETTSDKTDQNAKSSDIELKEGYITVKTAEGGEQALLITMQMPEIRGVAIVCEGGDNPIINEKIKNTGTAALNITSKRVYICGRNQK